MPRLLPGPVRDRLEWVLDGLDGTGGWGADAAEVFAPEYTATVPATAYVERTRRRVASFAPVRVIGLELTETAAKARLCDNTGETWVLYVTVEPDPPHRITMTMLVKLVPDGLSPRLPMDFADYPVEPAQRPEAGSGRPRLIVFSGLPGSGKSYLADAVGRAAGVPVFAVDWLLGALSPFGFRHADDLLAIGDELLTTLALRQLATGRSVLLDSPAEDPRTRQRWRSLARRFDAEFVAVLCECGDPAEHRLRVEGRSRGIPGWYDAGDWDNVTRRQAVFPPWPDGVLRIDTTQPNQVNIRAVLDRLAPASPAGS